MSNRTGHTIAAALVLAAAVSTAPAAASPTDPQACLSGHATQCFPSLAQAVGRAVNGDVITLGAGSFDGGVTISKSIRLVGAGAEATVIRGGGPVITVAATTTFRPKVEIAGVTVTGGRNTGVDLTGKRTGFEAFGGGILVPSSNRHGAPGASLTLRHVVIDRNVTAPSATSPSPSGARCPDGDCPYAGAYGAGIASAGPLVLDDVMVSNNTAGGTASDANGGGIYSAKGPVTITGSRITGNSASPAADTIGRFAEGGGITIGQGSAPTTIDNTRIEDNLARLDTLWPAPTEMAAQSGGLFMEGNTQLTITGSQLVGNRVIAHAPHGEVLAYVSALHYQYGGQGLRMEDTTLARNTLEATMKTTENVAPLGAVLEADGHAVLENVDIVDNTQTVRTTDGPAGLSGVVFLCGCDNGDGGVTDLTNVTVARNTSSATSDKGPAWVWGGGVAAVDGTHLTMRDSTVADNQSSATTLDGTGQAEVRGGGIWAGPLWGSDPTVDLTGTSVTRNSGTVSSGGVVLGGGLYSEVPVQGTEGITANTPDDIHYP